MKATIDQTIGSDKSAGMPAVLRKSRKERCSVCAAIMFCGLPMIVPAAPVLAAKQKASRKGIGLKPRASEIWTSKGVIATTTTSLVRSEERKPATTTRMASKTGGFTGSVAMRCATQA